MHRRLRFTGLALLGLVATAPAFAKPGHGEFAGSGFGMGFVQKLDLTPEQREQLKTIRQSGKEQGKALRDAAQEARRALKEAVSGTADDATVTKLFQDMHAKQQAAMNHGFQQLLKVRAILTPEQRVKMRELVEARVGKFQGRGRRGDNDEE